MSGKRRQRRQLMRIGAAGALGLLLMLGFVSFVHMMLASKSGKPQRQIQIVQLMRPPPPPPPPEEAPPPPPKTEEILPKDKPEPEQNDEPPPAEQMGLDAQGTAGSDAFGFASRHGGSDLIGGNGSAAFAWYTNRLKDAVVEKLSSDPRIGSKKFSLSVRVWLESDGRIKQVKLVTTTGDAALDQRIEADLGTLARLSEAPPLEMPQPISLKIVSRS